MPLDLFGTDSPIVLPKKGAKPILVRWASFANYRKATGSERCKNCVHFHVRHFSGTYFKCDMVGCSACPSTDIRANHVCKFHKPALPEDQ